MLELLIWLIPLLSSGTILAFGSLSKKFIKALASLTMLFCLFSSVELMNVREEVIYPWIPSLGLNFEVSLNEWSNTFNLVVSLVGTLILIYSFSYIREGFVRYYSIFLLFIGSMMMFVSSGNFIQLFIGWELMSVCSYLLIGFWYRRRKAVNAGLKAILTTKIGDACLLLAIFLIFTSTGSFSLSSLNSLTQFKQAISILLVFAVLTKSAQFPFYFWLVDAMEGPSTVSALLHSATMVASGAFLLLRVLPIMTSESLFLLLTFSSISVLLGGFLALTNYDIKKILAFSTISQLAFMILAIASFDYLGGFLHMINHAFFKSLLFLCAGVFIHYSQTRDLRKIRVSRKYVPILFSTSLIGILSLAGIPPLNGFWSKELILDSSLENYFLFTILSIGTLLTILYSFRLFSRVFSKGRVKERFGLIQFSTITLALICVILGFFEASILEFKVGLIIFSSALLGLGCFLSYIYFFKGMYVFKGTFLFNLLKNEFYLERLFSKLSKISEKLSKFEGFDKKMSKSGFFFSKSFYRILELDLEKVQVKSLNKFFRGVYRSLKSVQTSYLNYNILVVVIGIAFLLFLIIMGG